MECPSFQLFSGPYHTHRVRFPSSPLLCPAFLAKALHPQRSSPHRQYCLPLGTLRHRWATRSGTRPSRPASPTHNTTSFSQDTIYFSLFIHEIGLSPTTNIFPHSGRSTIYQDCRPYQIHANGNFGFRYNYIALSRTCVELKTHRSIIWLYLLRSKVSDEPSCILNERTVVMECVRGDAVVMWRSELPVSLRSRSSWLECHC